MNNAQISTTVRIGTKLPDYRSSTAVRIKTVTEAINSAAFYGNIYFGVFRGIKVQ